MLRVKAFLQLLFYLNGPCAAVNLRAMKYSESLFNITCLGLGTGTVCVCGGVRGGDRQRKRVSLGWARVKPDHD